ncbi:MAG TPA: bifunctional serine/threonine-protein kinase/formylglycine-generating enzyme family protein [Myxococcales bacterium]|nr:bifunctional serine/threonine-protein kinase/formylglycine-generating enzyme family protein [Myxococcales bacterium]
MDSGAPQSLSPPAHLTDEVLLQFASGSLAAEGLAAVREHAADCDDCGVLLLAVLRGDEETYVPPADGPASPPPSPPWTPPATFGVFRLGRELGRGGMGVVYHAYNLALRREVALKFIGAAHPEVRLQEFFQDELLTLASFQHPNIVTVYSSGEVDDHAYIETEHIQGQSLSDLPRPLPWPRVLHLGVELARGLAAAHRKKVLHRDLKPSNAMETEDGVVKLLDFGLAERLAPDASAGSKGVAGTMLYMAPECLEGAPATERSDLYSLGVLLFQLLSDRIPAEDDPLGPGVDPDLAAVIERCLRADPDQRMASAELLFDALRALQARLPLAPRANPYRGLAPFEAEHQALFFGRDADARDVLDKLRRQPLVLVAAESGTGKSSLCRAGILPRAATGSLVEGRMMSTLSLSPGARPLEAMAAALAPLLSCGETELFTRLADDPGWLGHRLRTDFRDKGGLLLFVDQLEELVTMSDSSQRDAAARVLGTLSLPSPAVRVLLAVRGDFFTRVAALPALGEQVERALYLLRPMSPEALREAIVSPAHACGVSFESNALIRQLVETTAHGTGSLPLLSFALTELWERRDVAGARITHAALDAMGGVAGMLSRHADGVVARLTAAQTVEARRLLVRLTTEERTRNELGLDELGASSADARVALDALVDGRLLQTRTEGGQVRYQIAHDALIHRWEMLRTWLDDDRSHRALRQRVEAAAAEWIQADRSPDALWPQRRLRETQVLSPSALGPRELEFLAASRRRVARRTWLRRLAAALAALVVASPYAGFRLQQWLEERRFVAARLQAAQEQLRQARDLGQAACARRGEALALFAPPSPGEARPAGTSRWDKAEDQWEDALAAYGRAGAAYRAAEQTLQGALDHQHRRQEARQMLAGVAYGQLELEECFHPQGEGAPEVWRLVTRFDDEGWRQRVRAPGELELVTDPPGARVEIERYVDAAGALRPERVPIDPGPTPIRGLRLSPGSYRFRFRAPGRPPVLLPALLARGRRERIQVPIPARVPEGMVYVPPGCFLAGSDDPEALRRDVLGSSPLHQVCAPRGYFIGKTEITFGDWLRYLGTLPAGAEARRVLEPPRQVPAADAILTLHRQPVAGWVLSFYRSGSLIFTAWEGEDFHYPARAVNGSGDWRRLPLSGVSAVQLEGYFAWLDRTGQLRGARLCSEEEWEHAARGADARAYPGGDQLATADANFDVTYGREPNAYGPDMVGSHPGSASPYGVLDLAGNAMEMTLPLTPEQGDIVLRGGSWYHTRRMALVAWRNAGEPTLRSPFIGARACAPDPGTGPE